MRWVGSLQGAVHMAAARLGCERTIVGTSGLGPGGPTLALAT